MEVELTPAKKNKAKTSWTWSHYTYKPEINPDVALCNLCKQEISRKGSTTNFMKNHLANDHQIYKPVELPSRAKRKKETFADQSRLELTMY